VNHEVRTFPDSDTAAAAAAAQLADSAAAAVQASGKCSWALSGGKTPDTMFGVLATLDVPWAHTSVFQVDERVAPDGDVTRNATHLTAALGTVLVDFVEMDVTAADLDGAAARYAALLPAHFDVVHLGLGADGHTASLVPGDAVLAVRDRLVAVAGPYQGHRRLTLTYPVLDGANLLVWLLAGADKHDALTRLLDGDTSIPAGRVDAKRSIVFTDVAAA
jgi:6-phosphogluconolactonase